MPRPTLPPTPASSTDIPGKDGAKDLASLQLAFELPPPAMVQDADMSPTNTRTSPPGQRQPTSPAKASYPMQAAETVKSRRRASTAAQKPAGNQAFALPPPPTRSRKIIQMKPRPAHEDTAETAASSSKAQSTSGASKSAAAAAAASGTNSNSGGNSTITASKKKQPSATSAVGRKIARKTAHSLIERRRRSKMNEEFAVLKGMIPACTGEMHKLAILQASIEYVRYLEDCVAKLKEQHDAAPPAQTPTDSGSQTPSGPGPWQYSLPQFAPTYHGDPSGDVDMTGSEAPSPTFTAQHPHPRSQQPSVSPAILPEDVRHRHNSQSSASTTADHRHYSYSLSANTSPAFGPNTYLGGGEGPASLSLSALTSPALMPQREQRDLDQEATAALLMLNSDRRGTHGGGGMGGQGQGQGQGSSNSSGTGRGMSVRDLLST